MHTRTFLLQPHPDLSFLEPRGHCPSQVQNCPVKVIHGQTFCPLFVVLKNVCMIKSQFPQHSLSYVRSDSNKLPQDTNKYMQFFLPYRFLQPPLPAYLISDIFSTPRLLPPPSFRTGEYFIFNIFHHIDYTCN